jgi:hypothetical protein
VDAEEAVILEWIVVQASAVEIAGMVNELMKMDEVRGQ